MRLLIVIASLLLVGCASLANTPAQERTWAQVDKCGGNSLNVTVAPNGAWRGHGVVGPENRAFVTCMGGRW